MFKLPFLKPKDNKFCVLLEGLSTHARACAVHLKSFVESPDAAEQARAGEAITAARRQSKELTAQIAAELCRTYITPFDREDIQDIANDLYKIPKTIEKIKDRVSTHGISSVGLWEVIAFRVLTFTMHPAQLLMGVVKIPMSRLVVGTAIGFVPTIAFDVWLGGELLKRLLAWLGLS